MFDSARPPFHRLKNAVAAVALVFVLAALLALWELVIPSSDGTDAHAPWVLLLVLSLAGLVETLAIRLRLERSNGDRLEAEPASGGRRVVAGSEEALHDRAPDASALPPASEVSAEAVVGSAAEGIVTTDPKGRVVWINPALERLIGQSVDDVRGRAYWDAFPAVDRRGRPIPEDQRLLPKALKLERAVYSKGFNLAFVRRNGTAVTVAVAASPILDDDGRVIGGVELVRELSYEREVDDMKTTLVSTVSHEVRTPLTMIQGFSELLLTRELAEDKSYEALKQINSSAERLARLIDDLLSVTRIESGRLVVKTVPVEVPSVIDEVLAPFVERNPDRNFHRELDDDLPRVLADRDKLVHVLTNLLSNAIKYSRDGRPVFVFARRTDSSVEIAVEDRGIGLSEEEIPKVFDKFFRSERAELHGTTGSGLGLFIVKSFVEMQGGRLSVSTELGRGSTFSFSLPAEASDRVLVPAPGARP